MCVYIYVFINIHIFTQSCTYITGIRRQEHRLARASTYFQLFYSQRPRQAWHPHGPLRHTHSLWDIYILKRHVCLLFLYSLKKQDLNSMSSQRICVLSEQVCHISMSLERIYHICMSLEQIYHAMSEYTIYEFTGVAMIRRFPQFTGFVCKQALWMYDIFSKRDLASRCVERERECVCAYLSVCVWVCVCGNLLPLIRSTEQISKFI